MKFLFNAARFFPSCDGGVVTQECGMRDALTIYTVVNTENFLHKLFAAFDTAVLIRIVTETITI